MAEGPIPDPVLASGNEEDVLDAFRRVRDEILDRVRDLLEKSSGQPGSSVNTA